MIDRMLVSDPTRRITVEEALVHPYLSSLHDISDEPTCRSTFEFDFEPRATSNLTPCDAVRSLIWEETLLNNPHQRRFKELHFSGKADTCAVSDDGDALNCTA